MLENQRISILQPWVMRLPLRMQGTLLAAIRGADGLPKENDAKFVLRGIRQSILVPADPRELELGGSYMSVTSGVLLARAEGFIDNRDHYPLHFYLHVLHAVEVIGHEGPGIMHGVNEAYSPHLLTPLPAVWWNQFYCRICTALHVNPETKQQLWERMLEDRLSAKNP